LPLGSFSLKSASLTDGRLSQAPSGALGSVPEGSQQRRGLAAGFGSELSRRKRRLKKLASASLVASASRLLGHSLIVFGLAFKLSGVALAARLLLIALAHRLSLSWNPT
jgi:hypothetical protein